MCFILSPFKEEQNLGANEHIDFFSFAIEVFLKSVENITVIVGDICATKKAFARKMGCVFNGCASHQYNLALNVIILVSNEDIVEKVRQLMKALPHPVPAAVKWDVESTNVESTTPYGLERIQPYFSKLERGV